MNRRDLIKSSVALALCSSVPLISRTNKEITFHFDEIVTGYNAETNRHTLTFVKGFGTGEEEYRTFRQGDPFGTIDNQRLCGLPEMIFSFTHRPFAGHIKYKLA